MAHRPRPRQPRPSEHPSTPSVVRPDAALCRRRWPGHLGTLPLPNLALREAGGLPGAAAAAAAERSAGAADPAPWPRRRSEEHTSELQSLMRISYAVFCLKKKKSIIDINDYR